MTAVANTHAPAGWPARARAVVRSGPRPFGLTLVWVTWLVVIFEPHWYAAKVLGSTFPAKLPTILLLWLAILAWQKRPKGVWLWPLAAMTLFTLVTFRLAENPGYAERAMKQFLFAYILALGLVAFVRTPKQAAAFIISLLGWQMLWWATWGLKRGRVAWHPSYANADSYGPLCVLGAAGAFHLAMAVRSRALKVVFYATSAICVLGVVSAFARGATLAFVAMLFFAWLRSPRKGMMTLGILGAAAGVVLAATVIFAGVRRGGTATARGSSFFAEMATSFDEGGTRGDREVLWGAAIEVWRQHPFIGVGGQSFGPFASTYFKPGEIGGDYAQNPRMLYDRALHNIFVQILCEYGLIGSAIMLWMLVDFWKRNWRLQGKTAIETWRAHGERLDIHAVALGLESMMVGFLCVGFFYNVLEVHWLYTLVALNALLHRLAFPPAPRPPVATPARRR